MFPFIYEAGSGRLATENYNHGHRSCKPTAKNDIVDPPQTVPYFMVVCLARSSAFSMGEDILSTVRKAARLAV